MANIKNLLAPLQAWLLSQGKCVGCGRELSKAGESQGKKDKLYTCSCGRIYIKDPKTKKYRRALLDEV